jgi:hypothetical protein
LKRLCQHLCIGVHNGPAGNTGYKSSLVKKIEIRVSGFFSCSPSARQKKFTFLVLATPFKNAIVSVCLFVCLFVSFMYVCFCLFACLFYVCKYVCLFVSFTCACLFACLFYVCMYVCLFFLQKVVKNHAFIFDGYQLTLFPNEVEFFCQDRNLKFRSEKFRFSNLDIFTTSKFCPELRSAVTSFGSTLNGGAIVSTLVILRFWSQNCDF